MGSTKKQKTTRRKKRSTQSQSFLKRRVSALVFGLLSIFGFGLLGLFYAWNYSEIHALYPVYVIDSSADKREIEPYDRLQFKFSQPVKEEGLRNAFSVSPDLGGKIEFFGSFLGGYSTGFTFVPDGPLDPEQQFIVHVDALESIFGTRYPAFTDSFNTVTAPRIVAFPFEGEKAVSVNSLLHVQFDKGSKYFSHTYSLSPELQVDVVSSEGGETTLKPKKAFEQGTEYTLSIAQIFSKNNTLGASSEVEYDSFSYLFKTVDPVVVESASPSAGEDRASIDSEIEITFDRPVEYEMAENAFSIEPEVEGDFGWDDRTLIFNPKNELSNPQEYTIRINAGVQAFEDSGFLSEDYSYSFKARRHEKEVEPDDDLVAAITEGKYIDVDLGSQYMTLFEDGKSRGSFEVSSGRYDLPTPIGTFNVINKVPLAYSQIYDLYMPFWMAFTYVGHGFHELPFWKYRGGIEYKERESHLGTKVSHGCVRLGVGSAEIAYNFADVGTPIVIHE